MNELTLFDPVMTLVARNIQGRDATQEESVIIDSAWINAESSIRAMAWLSREGKTWKSLKNKAGNTFTSFEQYGKERFGYEPSYLSRLCGAYETQNLLKLPIGNLDIPETHLRPLSQVPDDIKKQIWEQVNEENKVVTAKLIAEAVADYKESVTELSKEKFKALADKENWRQQYLDQRNSCRELQTELINTKSSKKETIYIDDSSKALEQYREETEKKLARLQGELKETRDGYQAEVAKRVDNRLKNHSEVIEKLQKQETSLQSSIDFLINKEHQLDKKIGVKAEQLEARKSYKDHLEHLAIAANVLFDESFDDEDRVLWMKLLNDTAAMSNTFLNLIDNSEGLTQTLS